MKNTWWVEYKYTYEFHNGFGWVEEYDFGSGRFRCNKKDIPNKVREYIEEYELRFEKYRNLQIKITDKYITSDVEL